MNSAMADQSEKSNQKGPGLSLWILIGILGFMTFMVLKSKKVDKEAPQEAQGMAVENTDASKLKTLIQSSEAEAVLVNMWATWCGPCVEEFPYLLELRENYQDQGLEVLLVSMDMKEELPAVQQFLMDQNVNFVTYIKNQGDNDFINEINPDWSGALPATFIYSDKAELKKFWTGDAKYEDFEKEVLEVLNPQSN